MIDQLPYLQESIEMMPAEGDEPTVWGLKILLGAAVSSLMYLVKKAFELPRPNEVRRLVEQNDLLRRRVEEITKKYEEERSLRTVAEGEALRAQLRNTNDNTGNRDE